MFDFSGRRILVTGAAGGLGSALTRLLVECGAHVTATDVDDQRGETLADALDDMRTARGSWSYLTLDQSDTASIAPALEAHFAEHAPVDSVVNNAALYPKASLKDLAPDEYARVLTVNSEAATAFARVGIDYMRRQGFGRIINIASITFDLGFEELSAYVASKGALVGLTRVWARELGCDGTTVNAIAPGAFETDAEKIHPNPERYNRYVLDQQSVKRRGTPRDFAELAAFLLSTHAGFITGQTIRLDGGWVMA